jgi:hypothetical protein
MLKVYKSATFRYGVQVFVIAAVNSQAEFSRLIGESLHNVRRYASVTHNRHDVLTALSEPHTVFWHKISYIDGPYHKKDWFTNAERDAFASLLKTFAPTSLVAYFALAQADFWGLTSLKGQTPPQQGTPTKLE